MSPHIVISPKQWWHFLWNVLMSCPGMELVILTDNPSFYCPAAVKVFPREGILPSAVTIGVAPNTFEGKFSFPIIFYFNLSNRPAPLLMSEMLLPLSGRKEGVDQHRQDLQLSSRSLNANLMDLSPKMKEISEHLDCGYLRFYTSLLHFPVTINNETPENETTANSHPDRI